MFIAPNLAIPVAVENVSAVLTGAPIPVTEYGTETPRIDRNSGQPLFSWPVLLICGGRSATVYVKVPGVPPLADMAPGIGIAFADLVAIPWSRDTRGGVSFSARGVTLLSTGEVLGDV